MTPNNASLFLRRVLAVDAASSAAAGLLMLAAAGSLSPLSGLPAPLLRGAGLVLLPYAALVAWMSVRPRVPRPAVWAVAAANAIWAADSLLLLLSGWARPTGLGITLVVVQAAAVAVIAELQVIGLRRPGPQPARTATA